MAKFSGDFITTSITYDQYVDALKGGFGIILMSDQIAKTLNSNEASFSYSYHQHITRKFTLILRFKELISKNL